MTNNVYEIIKKLNYYHTELGLFTSNSIYILFLSTNSFEYTLII